jgi:hypothetical protein
MLGKKLLWLVIGLGFLSSAGCCRFWDRVCHDGPHYQPAPYCQPQCPPGCAPGGPAFSSPAAVPVPSAPRTSWQGCP